MTEPFRRLFVAGAGSWGTALAVLLARNGAEVTLWARDEVKVHEMVRSRRNPRYLTDIELPAEVTPSADPGEIANADAALLVIPAQALGGQLAAFATAAADGLPVALCSKGIEADSGRFMHEVLARGWPGAAPAVLSGPSFADDVARGLPTAITLADRDPGRGQRWLETLSGPTFRPYYTPDVAGAEIGGAIKNVLAIACGIVVGKGLGESARAALIARGFAEALRFADVKDADPETLHGLSGLGDLILTCSSTQSRNFSFGRQLGAGKSAADLLALGTTVEGAATAPVLKRLASEAGVEMPITDAVAALVEGKTGVDEAIGELLSRPLRHEG